MSFLQQAQPPLRFLPPQPNRTVLRVTQWLMPAWIRWRENLQRVESHNVDPLVYLMRDFQAQQHRFLLAFRHPSPQDAFCLAHLLWYDVPRRAKQLGVTLDYPVHAHFIYDRGIPLWAGAWVGGFYSRLGGTPIQRGKLDRQGLRSARHLFANGAWPMAAAPEGGNNGHTELVSPLEPGIAQMGFWCVEDLQQAGRSEQVSLLPVGITYQYTPPPWDKLDGWLDRLEQETGLVAMPQATRATDEASSVLSERPSPAGLTDAALQRRYQRLLALGEHLLGVMEDYYQRVYRMPVVTPPAPFADRLEVLRDTALQVAETYFQLPPRGTMIDRCRRIEQAGWERIFRQELGEDQPLSAVARGLADREAEEASLRMWHMRLVENFVAVTGQYVRERPTAERFAETLMIVRDIVWLIKGENPFPRPKLGPQVATITVGEPISVSDRWPAYKAGRKQAVADLTSDLQLALERMIPQP
ncbi:glycerol acyltransferase [Leptolyngbya sp. BL0902]|uniref:1-acyl-sn-glycerol-3-phosphate acyltransferase n=1 Tax=Leptolyngbya sp. BL0902 TaxID=1115757 RepID=UPI0018E7DE2C|nr:1-acyl-sn-glycerol-3-phosphate acyltransferase [Leptolyngbya sp. BL0902]QQE63512.1 glycerol acyltransferase [Leptolyngbya sp. BL0902]